MRTCEESIYVEEKQSQESLPFNVCQGVNYCNDNELWSAFIAGNEKAFMKIYKDYFSTLCNFGLRYAPSDIVEDAVQDLFIHFRKNRQNLPQLKNNLRPFLFQCLKRRLYNMLKQNKEICKANIPDAKIGVVPCQESNIVINQDREVKLQRLDQALASLKKRHRQVIYCYYFQGMSYDEVSEVLGFQDVKSARNLVYKIIKNIRSEFFSKNKKKNDVVLTFELSIE